MAPELEGAALVVLGIILGKIPAPRRRRTPRLDPPLAPVCGCQHHKSYHDDEGCHAGYLTHELDKYGRKRGERSTVVVCGCKGYEGPVPYTEYSPEEKI
jgi:hypothetical protein